MGWPGVNLQTANERLAFAQARGVRFRAMPQKTTFGGSPMRVTVRGDRSGFFTFFGYKKWVHG